MRAKEVNIQELFRGNVVYVSPSFHRPYSWADGSCERILNVLGAAGPAPFFMGALVTLDLGRRPPGYRKALLIDGNSRLMTLLMLMIALRDTLRPLDAAEARRLDRACFFNAVKTPSPLFKNIVTRRDRGVFEAFALGAAPPGEGRPPGEGHPLEKVYRFGRGVFVRAAPASLRELAGRLLRQFTFVELALSRKEDPYPVFKLFNRQDDDFTRTGLDAYTQFSADPELMAMIADGESQEVEFKARAVARGKSAPDGPAAGAASIVRAVAGFMNSAGGGTLLIGVADDGRICGIESEYGPADPGKENWDGYQLFLSNLLRSKLDGKNAFLHYTIEKRTAQRHDICMIRVSPADEPAYIEKRFYVRTNNQTVEMIGPDLIDYVGARFAKAAFRGEGKAKSRQQGQGRPS